MAWLTANQGTIVVLAFLIIVVAFIIRRMIKDRRAGISSCGNNCSHCAMAGSCHTHKNQPSGKAS